MGYDRHLESAYHILVLHPIELRESSAQTISKSIIAQTISKSITARNSIKSCFPTPKTKTRSQVPIVSHLNADWFTLEKLDKILRSDKKNTTADVSKKSAKNQRSLSMLGCSLLHRLHRVSFEN